MGCAVKLAELQEMANKGYAGGESMTTYFNPKTGKPTKWHTGDALEWFMHVEIAETFTPTLPRKDQIAEAIRVLKRAQNDLQGAIDSLREGAKSNVR